MKADLDLFNEFWLKTERDKLLAPYAADMRKARPFTLNDEIDEMVGLLAYGAQNTDIISRRYLSAACLPYPIMWIEHGNAGFGRRMPPGVETVFGTPLRTGWLLQQLGSPSSWMARRVSRIVDESTGEPTAIVYPLIHVIETTGSIDYSGFPDPRAPSLDWSRAGRNVVARMNKMPSTALIGWGGPDGLSEDDDDSTFESVSRASPLYGTASILMDESHMRRVGESALDPEIELLDFMRRASFDHISELRYLVAALGLLNEIPVSYVPYRPSGNARVGGRLRPFMSSSVVSITVPATRRRLKDIDKLLQARGEAAKKARHEVRGHFRHVRKLPAKNPERWERAVDREGRPVWRTWIDHHLRGSAELGWVDQKYAVVPKHPGENRLTGDDLSDRG